MDERNEDLILKSSEPLSHIFQITDEMKSNLRLKFRQVRRFHDDSGFPSPIRLKQYREVWVILALSPSETGRGFSQTSLVSTEPPSPIG